MLWSLFVLFMMGVRSCFTHKLYEYHVVNVKKSWSDARAYCREHHTDLATVSDWTDQDTLRSLTVDGGEAWIGLFNNGSGDKIWHWSLPGLEDDNYTNWNPKEPNDANGEENCVLIRADKKWNDAPCTNRYPFVCYSDNNQSGKLIFNGNPMTWLEAQSFCRKHHTDLVSGQHQLQDDELKNITRETFIGRFRDTWRWSDGSSFSIRNWHQQIKDVQVKERCAVFMKHEEGWKLELCNLSKPFICYDGEFWDFSFCIWMSRDGSRRKPRTPQLHTSGQDCATPVLWISGSGSVTRRSAIRTGPQVKIRMTATCLEPWREEENISGLK